VRKLPPVRSWWKPVGENVVGVTGEVYGGNRDSDKCAGADESGRVDGDVDFGVRHDVDAEDVGLTSPRRTTPYTSAQATLLKYASYGKDQ
jgi:hypothetical protein